MGVNLELFPAQCVLKTSLVLGITLCRLFGGLYHFIALRIYV